MLQRFGEGSVNSRCERVDEVRPLRVVEPEEASAEPAEIPFSLAFRRLTRSAMVVELRIVDREALPALDLQGVRVGPEVDREPAASCGLAADGAVAGLVRVRRLRRDPEADRAAMARTSKQHACLPPEASPAADLAPLRVERDVDVPVLHLDLVLRDGFDGWQALRGAGLHVELRAVEWALNLRVRKLTLAQVGELVGADVLEGVKLAIDVAKGDEAVIDDVLFDLPRTNLFRSAQLVELGH